MPICTPMWTTASSPTSAGRWKNRWRRIRRWRVAQRRGERKTAPSVRPSMAKEQGLSRSASFVTRTEAWVRADDRPRSAAKLRASSCRGRHRRALRASRDSRRRRARRELFERRCRCGLASRLSLCLLCVWAPSKPVVPDKGLERPASRRSAHSPVRASGGRIRDQRHGRIARVADRASLPPGLPSHDPSPVSLVGCESLLLPALRPRFSSISRSKDSSAYWSSLSTRP